MKESLQEATVRALLNGDIGDCSDEVSKVDDGWDLESLKAYKDTLIKYLKDWKDKNDGTYGIRQKELDNINNLIKQKENDNKVENKKIEETKPNFLPVGELPDMCYGLLPSDNSIIIIKKGENGYYETDLGSPENAEEVVNKLNADIDVTPDQRFTMELRSINGNWSDKKIESNKQDYYFYEIYFDFSNGRGEDGYSSFFKSTEDVGDNEDDIVDLAKKEGALDEDDISDLDYIVFAIQIDKDEYERATKTKVESKKLEDVDKLNTMYEQGTTELEKAFTTEVKYWLEELVNEKSNDEIGEKATAVLDDENKVKAIVDELVNGSEDLWEEIHLKIEQLAGIDYRNSI